MAVKNCTQVFPKIVKHAKAPPIKSQGIKTKLVPFILRSIKWDGRGRWIEPFVGSGAVVFNAMPTRALAADTNEHVIRVYQAIQSGGLTPERLRVFLEKEGKTLREKGEDHYYYIRERFNEEHSPLDLVFLNRACFNGVMRFNSKGRFNTPFCRKPDRFRPALITKICNQVEWVRRVVAGKDWTFVTQDWRQTLAEAREADFVYLDPPYVGRHTDYYNHWTPEEADDLAETVKALTCGFGYSMWKANRYRENGHILDHFTGYPLVTYEHFYHVGSFEALRNSMEEALVISPISVADLPPEEPRSKAEQAGLPF